MRVRQLWSLLVFAALALAVAPGSAVAGWQDAGQPTTTADAGSAGTVIGGVPYAAWTELGTPDHVRVATWSGSTWSSVVGPLSVSAARFAAYPSIAGVDGVPWVAFVDRTATRDEVRVAKPSGAAWQLQGSALNTSATEMATEPRIASIAGVPYVTFLEFQGSSNRLRVRRWNAGAWESVGGDLNIGAASAQSPSIVDVAGTAYVAWNEGGPTGDLVHVKRWTGTAWAAVGDPVVHPGAANSTQPALAVDGGVPYVGWVDGQAGGTAVDLRVARFTGGAWTELGTAPVDSQDLALWAPSGVSLVVAGGRPTVGWGVTSLAGGPQQLRFFNWNERAWTRIGAGPLARDPAASAGRASALDLSGSLFVVWPEADGTGVTVNASRLVNDAATAALRFTAATYAVRESEGFVLVTVQRTGGTAGAVAVNYATSNGSATAGADFTASSGTVSFADGQTFRTIAIPVTADGVAEPPEAFTVTLSSPGGDATLGTPAATTVALADDEIDTRITFGPAGPTNTAAPAFTFVAEPALGATFECAVDGAAYAACTSPHVVGGLADGSHGFQVRARTPGGSADVTPASRTFLVDTRPPSAQPVLAGTPGPSAGRYTGTVGVAATGDDPAPGSGVESVRCVLDPPAPPAGFDAMPAGCGGSTSAPGDHVVYAAARDAAGNTSVVPGVVRFSIDEVPDTFISSGPEGVTSSLPVAFGFRSTVAGARFECRLDGAPFAVCTSPREYSFTVKDGAHVFEVRAIGPTGGVDPTPASRAFTLGPRSVTGSCSGNVPFGDPASVDLKFSLGGVRCVALRESCPAGASCTLTLTAGVTDADGMTPWTSNGEIELRPGSGSPATDLSSCASTPQEAYDSLKNLFSDPPRMRACSQASSTSMVGPAAAKAECRVARALAGSGYHTRGLDSQRRHTCSATLDIKPARVLGVTLGGTTGATTVPSAGALAITGSIFTGRAAAARAAPFLTIRTRPKAAGVVRFMVRLRGSAATTLRRRGRLRMRLTVAFTAANGERTVSRQVVTMRRPRPKVVAPKATGPAKCKLRPTSCTRRGGKLVPR